MLFIKSEEGNLLNYNDFNIPVYTRNRIFKKLDKIDILLNNYNHAGKLFDYRFRFFHNSSLSCT